MKGLVLEGGGTKGAYQIGVIKAMKEKNIEFGAVTGTSIGALNGAMVAMGKIDRVIELWHEMKPERLIKGDPKLYQDLLNFEINRNNVLELSKAFLASIKQKGLDISPLKELIEEELDEELLRKGPVRFGLVTVSISDRKPIEVFVEDIPKGQVKNYLLASSYLPIFKMDKINGKWFVDGGFYDNVPINLMRTDKRINEIYVVQSPGISRKKRANSEGCAFHFIEPSQDLGRSFDFSMERIKTNISMGYYDALRVLDGLAGHQYYLKPIRTDRLFEVLLSLKEEQIRPLLEILGIRGKKDYRRSIFEDILPRLIDILDLDDNISYEELITYLVEGCAAYLDINRYAIYQLEELFELTIEKLSHDQYHGKKKDPSHLKDLLRQTNIYVGEMKQELLVDIFTSLFISERGAEHGV